MRKFGLIGGTSWHSTVDYYRELNKTVNQRYNNNTNPPLYLANLNQNEIHKLQQAGEWQIISEILITKCQELESIGCEGLAFCANTPHRVYDTVQNQLNTPIIHIGASVGKFIQKLKYKNVGLLGTRFTMEGDFIKGLLRKRFSISVLTPGEIARVKIQDLLYNEMSHGHFTVSAQSYFLSVIDQLKTSGAEAVILGCTEFPILLRDAKTSLPKIDSAMCHIEDIAKFILNVQDCDNDLLSS